MDADDAEHNRPSEEALNKEEEEDDATVGAAAATETKSAASFQHPRAVLDEEEEKEEEEAGGSGGIEDKDPWELVREIEPDEETVECGTDECSEPAAATWTTRTDPNFRIHLCTNCEDEQISEYVAGAGKEVNELWDVVRVIPTEEEKVQCCCVHGCINPAVATWSSNIDPEEILDLCEDCQVEEMGGWPDGENKRRKYEIELEADRTTGKLSNEYNFEDNDNDDAEDKDKVDDKDEVATHYQQAVPQHQLRQYLTMEAKDDIVVEILRRRKIGEKWDSIAETIGRKETFLKTIYYSSARHKSEYKRKIVEKEQKQASQTEATKKKREEAAKKKREKAAKKKREEAAKKKREEAAAAKKKGEEAAKKKREEAAKKKREEAAAAKKKGEEAAAATKKKREEATAATKKKQAIREKVAHPLVEDFYSGVTMTKTSYAAVKEEEINTPKRVTSQTRVRQGEVSKPNRWDPSLQFQNRLQTILSEDKDTATIIEGHNELFLVYVIEFTEFTGKLSSSITSLISNIEQKNKLNVYDGKGEVAVVGYTPDLMDLCWARNVTSFKKIPFEIFGEKRSYGLTTREKMHHKYFPDSIGCVTPMGTMKGSYLKKIDERLYNCIVKFIEDVGFELSEAVLLNSSFNPIMYNNSTWIKGGAGKGSHHDAPGGGTIVASWGASAPLKIHAMHQDLAQHLPLTIIADSLGEAVFKKKGEMNVVYLSRRANFFRKHEVLPLLKSGTAFSVAIFLPSSAPSDTSMVQMANKAGMSSC